jgi:hypothetical protein
MGETQPKPPRKLRREGLLAGGVGAMIASLFGRTDRASAQTGFPMLLGLRNSADNTTEKHVEGPPNIPAFRAVANQPRPDPGEMPIDIRQAGLAGASNQDVGVRGKTDTGISIIGLAGGIREEEPLPVTATATAVFGWTTDGTGIWGASNRTGAWGVGQELGMIGTLGELARIDPSRRYPPTAVFGDATQGRGTGVWGAATADPGVWGTSQTGPGGRFESQDPRGAAAILNGMLLSDKVGSGMIPRGMTMATVELMGVTPQSHVVISLQTETRQRFWVTPRVDAFDVNLSGRAEDNIAFTYSAEAPAP